MKISEILGLVEPEWQAEFLRFTQTGEAEEEFMAYLERDAGCQKACETVVIAQMVAMQEFARAFGEGSKRTENRG